MAATKQSRRARVPVVAAPASTGRRRPDLGRSPRAGSPRDRGRTALRARGPTTGDVVVVVGPEGGITEVELATLVSAGGRPVRLGPEGAAILDVRTGRPGGALRIRSVAVMFSPREPHDVLERDAAVLHADVDRPELVLARGDVRGRPSTNLPCGQLLLAVVYPCFTGTALAELPDDVRLEDARLSGDDDGLALREDLTRVRAVDPDRGELLELPLGSGPGEGVRTDRLEDQAAARHGDRHRRGGLLDGGRDSPDQGLDREPLSLLRQPGDAPAR